MSVFLFHVDFVGTKSPWNHWCPDPAKVAEAYAHYEREINGDRIDPSLRAAVHAVRDGKFWPRNPPNVVRDGYIGPDRSCHPERCDCENLGLPAKTHPYRV